LSDPDLSYSDRDKFSNDSDHSDTILTKTTAPNMVDTLASLKYKKVSNDLHSEKDHIDIKGGSTKEPTKVLLMEIQYQSKQDAMEDCVHTNDVNSEIDDDICNVTLTTSGIELSNLKQVNGWQHITEKIRKKRVYYLLSFLLNEWQLTGETKVALSPPPSLEDDKEFTKNAHTAYSCLSQFFVPVML
jgi:hypothetical protein